MLYIKEGWTIVDQLMQDFENRLQRMQLRFDYFFSRIRSTSNTDSVSKSSLIGEITHNMQSPASADLFSLYADFFELLHYPDNKTSSYRRLKQLESLFHAIARVEVGESFYKTTMFYPSSNGSILIHVNWRYLYINRQLLESNWRGGCYQAELIDGAPDVSQPNQREGIYCVYFDRVYLAAGSRDHIIRLWNVETMQYRKSLHAHEASVLCLQLDSDRNMLVSGSSDSTIKVWDIQKGEVVQTLRGHEESVLGLHFDDTYIVSCSRDSTARIWVLSDAADSKSPAVGSTDYDSENRRPKYTLLHILRGHRAAVNSVHIKATTIATASGDRTVKLWNLATGAAIRTIGAHARGIACVNITGDYVVTGSSDHVIKIFDINSGEEVRTLRGHTGLVRTIQTDNTKIISGSYDQSIRIWDLKTGDMLQELGRCHDSKSVLFIFI